MRGLIDLHVHTTASDGTLSPSGAVELARELGLSAIAITDHDTADGVSEAVEAGRKLGIEVVTGIELSVDYEGHGVHILAYFIDPEADALKKLLDWVVWERERRNMEIAAAINADGIELSMNYMHSRFPDSIIGRPHFAAVLAEKGYAENVYDAFVKYLNKGRPYYRKRQYIPIDMAFATIKSSGGIASMAHPLQYRVSHEKLLEMTDLFCEKGLGCMECIYSLYTPEQQDYLRSIARERGLIVTGGSDCHGSRKPHIQMGSGCGDMEVTYEILENMKKLLIK